MSAVAEYDKLLRKDQNLYDGVKLTGSREDETTGRTSGLKVNDSVDVVSVYGYGTDFSGGAIQRATTRIGSSTKVGLVLAPGTWSITESITIGSNFELIIPRGAVLDISSGVTLTLNCTMSAGVHQIFSGSGTVSGSLVVNRVYPEWFGAARDGSTDDATAINSAVTLANGITGELYFSGGTYLIKSSITVQSNVSFVGIGPQSIVKVGDNADTQAFYSFAGVSDVSFRNFKIDGNKANQTTGDAIRITSDSGNNSGITISGMKFSNVHRIGIKLGGGSGSTSSVRVIGNEFSGVEAFCVNAAGGVEHLDVSHNYAESDCGQIAYIAGTSNTSDHVSVIGNHLKSSAGISAISNGTDVVINGNILDSPTTDAIVCSSSNAVISGNLIRGGSCSIVVSGNNCSVTGNHSESALGEAINITGNQNLVSGNVISNPHREGIEINGADDCVISGNCLDDDATCAYFGIHVLGSSTGVIVSGNRVNGFTNAAGGGIKFDSTVQNSLMSYNHTENNTSQYSIDTSGTNVLVDTPFKGTTVNSISDGETTPGVQAGKVFKTANSSSTTITNFENALPGQQITVIFGDSNTIVDFTGTSLKGNGGSNWSPTQNDHMTCVYDGTNWYCDISDNTA